MKANRIIKALASVILCAAIIFSAIPTVSALPTLNKLSAEYTASLIENVDGYIAEDELGREYFEYDLYTDSLMITFTYTNGETETLSLYELLFETEEEVYITSDQSATNQWKVGTHKVKVTVGTASCYATVEVAENPIESIEARYTDTLMEGYDGYYDWDINEDWLLDDNWDWDAWNPEDYEYFRYNFNYESLNLTIYMKDGTVEYGTPFELVEFFGHDTDVQTDQSYDNQWDCGMHTATAVFMGHSADFTVEIVENPVESVSAYLPYDLVEDADCYTAVGYDFENDKEFNYKCYLYDDVMVTINYKDGDTITIPYYYAESVTGYPVEIYDQQGNGSTWKVGANKAYGSFLGYDFEFDINIIKNPYTSVTIGETANRQFSVTLTDANGVSETYVAKDLSILPSATKLGTQIYVTADKGNIILTFYYGNSIGSNLTVKYGKLTSNTLTSCGWLNAYESATSIQLYAQAYQLLFSDECIDYIRDVNLSVPFAACISANLVFEKLLEDADDGDESFLDAITVDEEEGMMYVTLDEPCVRAKCAELFGEGCDLTALPGYNADEQTLCVPLLLFYMLFSSGYQTVSLTYNNGYWTYVSAYEDIIYNPDGEPMEIVERYMTVRLDESLMLNMIHTGKYITAGDVNLDGKVNLKDLFRLKTVVLGTDRLDYGTPEFISADFDNNDKINLKDVFSLKLLMMGLSNQ